jgi:biopolymer transport protein ExbD
MNSIGRLDVIALALMLIYIFGVVIHVCWRDYVTRRKRENDSASRRTLAAVLSIEVSSLKAIALTAPYLGLVGACAGILSAFGGFAMQEHAFLAILATRMAAALIPTAAGMPVAVLATCSHNYLRTRIDWLEGEGFDEERQTGRSFRGARRFPLTKRFSELPAFGLMAAPGLAILLTGYMTFASFHTRTGFAIQLAPARCEYDGDDRLIVLHITDAGKLLLNLEPTDWNSLAGRLSEIYSMREDRTLYLLADPGVPFQTVADALDTVENAPAVTGSQAGGMRMEKLDITVRLLTPTALNAHCLLKPVATGSGHPRQTLPR